MGMPYANKGWAEVPSTMVAVIELLDPLYDIYYPRLV